MKKPENLCAVFRLGYLHQHGPPRRRPEEARPPAQGKKDADDPDIGEKTSDGHQGNEQIAGERYGFSVVSVACHSPQEGEQGSAAEGQRQQQAIDIGRFFHPKNDQQGENSGDRLIAPVGKERR